MLKAPRVVALLLFLLGCGLAINGVSMIYPPLAFILIGIALVALAMLGIDY